MAAPIVNTTKGALLLNGLPAELCFNSWVEVIEALPQLLSVEIPVGAGAVVVSIEQPSAENRNKLWARFNNNGIFTGLYVFSEGAWQYAYIEPPRTYRWFEGPISSCPPLWKAIVAGDDTFPAALVNALVGQYIPDGSGGYLNYAARFIGY